MVEHPWSKLQTSLYRIIDPMTYFQIHSCSYSTYGAGYKWNNIPRYWITIEKEIIWDYPRLFKEEEWTKHYPWGIGAQEISSLIREYIDCPTAELLSHQFDDKWKLIPILQVCDKRIGKRRLGKMLEKEEYNDVRRIILKRLDKNNVTHYMG